MRSRNDHRSDRNRRGDAASPIVMWLGVILAAIIATSWFLLNARPVQQENERSQHDLDQITRAVDLACTSVAYTKLYNPTTEKGQLVLNRTHACVDTATASRCAKLTCTIASAGTFDLGNLTDLVIAQQNKTITITKR